MQYDAMISLGSFCQMGAALWIYGLKQINSPLDNFGIKSWENIPEILENRFRDYWRPENMATGKVVEELSSLSGSKRPILKAYDNRYNLVSNHNFHADENSPGNLSAYPEFRRKLKFIEDVFLKQCRTYDRVRFVLKAMSWPNPEATPISLDTVDRLVDVLAELREGKYFDLSLAVPTREFEKAKQWESRFSDFPVRITSWNLKLNNDRHPEWEEMFAGFELDPNHYWKLVSEIIGDAKCNLQEVNRY